MWNTILFDLDGTLTDSGEGIMKSVQYALQRCFGIKVDDDRELREFVGPPLKLKMMEYTGCSPEEADLAVSTFRERYVPVGIYENKLYPGITDMLGRLKAEGFQLAVASSKPDAMCHQVLRHFGIDGYFSVILGSSGEGKRAEKACIIEDVIAWFGMQGRRDEIVMVGDTVYDVEGAKSAGISCIGVTYGYGERRSLEKAWPACIVDTPEEAANVLIGQARAEGHRPPEPHGGDGNGTPGWNGVNGGEKEADCGSRATSRAGAGTDGSGAGSSRAMRLRGGSIPSDGGILFRIWRLIYPLLIDGVVTYAIVSMCMMLLTILGYNAFRMVNRLGTEVTGAADAVLLLIFVLLYRGDEQRRLEGGAGWRIPRRMGFTWTQALYVSVFTICTSEVIGLLTNMVPIKDARYEAVQAMLAQPSVLTQVVVVGLIGPLAEEFLFRGVVFRRALDYIGFWPAAFFCGLAFGGAHGNLTQGLFAGAFGVVLCCLYEHFGTLAAPIAAHVANNLFSIVEPDVFRFLGTAGSVILMLVCIVAAVVLGRMIFFSGTAENAV